MERPLTSKELFERAEQAIKTARALIRERKQLKVGWAASRRRYLWTPLYR